MSQMKYVPPEIQSWDAAWTHLLLCILSLLLATRYFFQQTLTCNTLRSTRVLQKTGRARLVCFTLLVGRTSTPNL